MHGVYRRAFGPESVVELSKNIVVQHDDFLRQDDPDKKADALRYMAGYAVQYLHLVPQEKKFTFPQTERVLHNSAMNIGEFDPREGSIAFTLLAKYAENLLEQPWRSDFHVIKLTSGFYVHNIAAQLQNAHELLIVMGYVNLDDRTLKLLPSPDYSRLKAVSRDCYIASQECLILSQIWQHVADQEPDYPLTIGEVFEYRKNHLGDTDTICNKLMYDIRARMHALKLSQPQPSVPKSSFVPVDRLIDFDAGDEPDFPERDLQQTQEHLKTLKMYNHDHIYDPVYGSEQPPYYRRPSQHEYYIQPQVPPKYGYPSRKSAPQVPYQNNFNNNLMYTPDSRNSVSPMIPKTVTSFFSTPVSNGVSSSSSGSRNNVSKSNSMNSLNGRQGQIQTFNQPLTLSKVKETDLDGDREMYFNGNERSSVRVRKSMPPQPSQVYPDEFYPQAPAIVKPVAVYGATVNPPGGGGVPGVQNPYLTRGRIGSDGEDVLNEAYAYASEVNQIPKGPRPNSVSSLTKAQSAYQHQATPIPMLSDSDSHSSEKSRPSVPGMAVRSGSSTDASSWEGSVLEMGYERVMHPSEKSKPQLKRPSHIDIGNGDRDRDPVTNGLSKMRYADSSPESDIPQPPTRAKNGYKELSSSSGSGGSGSPSSRKGPRNEELSSLDTVYYDYLLKQGHTDQLMSTENNRKSVSTSTSTTRSSQMQTQTAPPHEDETDGSHIYDGRRVIKKKQQQYEEQVRRVEKPDVNVHKKKKPVEGVAPDANYNSHSSKTLPEKNFRAQATMTSVPAPEKKVPVESSVPPLVPWNCRFCTFKNTVEERICEVCAKSKDFFDEEDPVQTVKEAYSNVVSQASAVVTPAVTLPKMYSVPSTSPPDPTPALEPVAEDKTCPQCTLINPGRARVCEICNYRWRSAGTPPADGFDNR